MGQNKAWMPLYIGDYLADTADLTTEEHGAYLLLLMHYWRTGPLPVDPSRLSNICKMSRHKYGKYSENILRFFYKKGDKYFHKRLDREIAKVTEISEKRAESARSRWDAKALQLHTQSQSQSHITKKDKRNTSKTSFDASFDAWWKIYPKKVEKKKARAIWSRRKLESLADTITADTQNRVDHDANWKAGYIPNPTTYLNGDRWDDEIIASRPADKTNGTKLYVPKVDDQLVPWASKHGFPSPGKTETYHEYRQRLWMLARQQEEKR